MDTDQKPPSPLSVFRYTHGMTRRELSRRSGLSEAGIGNLERGDSRPRLETAQALADALGVSVEEIFPKAAPDESREQT